MLEHPDALRPVVIPMYPDLDDDILLNNLRTIGKTRQDLEEALADPKRAKQKHKIKSF